jgi:PAS domain S-box-containing protein
MNLNGASVIDGNCHLFINKLEEGFELLELSSRSGETADFIFLEVNPAYERLTGLIAVDIVGRHKRDATPFAEERWYKYALQSLKTSKNLHYEYYNSGIDRYLETQFIPVSDKRIAVFFRDITESKKAEQAALESQERLRVYLESTPSAVFVATPEGKYLFVNESSCRLLNYTKKELLALDIPRVLCEDSLSVGLEQFEQVKRTGKSRTELCLKRRDGSPVYVTLTATKLPDGNLIANCDDVTERKALEKQLQAKERLAAIGSTAGMVGHDIRNPLQAIISDVFLLKDYLTGMPEGDVKNDVVESLNGIEKNIGYVNKIVADLQDFARPLNPEVVSVSLMGLVNSSLKTVDLPDSIRLEIKVENDMSFPTDPTFVQRAVTNLVNNAIQAMPSGGVLTVRGRLSNGRVLISVIDTGVGIPEEVKAKLFTPMTTTKAKGQGFGLAVVKRLIEALGGTVEFESEVGRGTSFTLCLPA